jgi:hypothetical protein
MRQRDKRVVIPLTLTSLRLGLRSHHTFSDAADAPSEQHRAPGTGKRML